MQFHSLRRVAFIAAIAFHLCAAAQPATFELQAHRGARALLPENSLAAFAFAMSTGVTHLELDIAITKDRELLISHDPALNPDITRDAKGSFIARRGPAIVTMTYAEVQQYDVGRIKPGTEYARQFPEQKPIDGTRIPKLTRLFDLAKAAKNDTVKFSIETKVTPTAPQETMEPTEFTRLVLKTIKDAGMESRSSILSFDWRTLQVVQKEAPGIETVYLTVQRNFDNIGATNPNGSAWTAGFQYKDHGSVPKMIKAAGGSTWSCYWRDLTPQLVREAQQLGIKVLAWTVNDPAQMRQMMDMGVNGIVTDRPDLLRAEMQKRGLPLPAATPVSAP
jgi:glycerophosphoryl diester phosphodiesterase